MQSCTPSAYPGSCLALFDNFCGTQGELCVSIVKMGVHRRKSGQIRTLGTILDSAAVAVMIRRVQTYVWIDSEYGYRGKFLYDVTKIAKTF